MSKTRVKLADLKRVCPQDLAHCSGYVWHLNSRIGKGSFGEVFLGWNSDGSREVAVKVVRKEFFRQDPKVRENLDREIRILKLLRGCEYVVHLHHKEDIKHFIVLVMELCEYDLDHLVKIRPFKEDDITLFLHQLALGMKALREQNIVHRDLKPGNILIKNDLSTGKMKIKLADFGFARHFTDEGMKPIDMTSLAGTPVFMAPEALRCVFHPGEHYDDKVDIWSIGALLYKVIVGQCGFYAQLQDIPKILTRKGDAIAFERVPHSRKINYILELPASVHDRFSEPFREKMNRMLCRLLKLDPHERMTFPEFFEYIDDLLTSKIEVINLLHGTTFKIIFDPMMTMKHLSADIEGQSGVLVQDQLIFSSDSPNFLAPRKQTSAEQFAELLNVAGGTKGHALLYLLPLKELQADRVEPELSCLSKLTYCVDDADQCVRLIVEHKFTTEVVHAISNLQAQQNRQLAGIQAFNKFCLKLRESMNPGQSRASNFALEARARGTLAMDWLMADLDQLAATSLPDTFQLQLKAQLQAVNQLTSEIDKIATEITSLQQSCQEGLGKGCQCDLVPDELAKVAVTLSEEAKKLPKMRKDYIHPTCKTILEDCRSHITEVTEKVRTALRASHASLAAMWGMYQKEGELQQKCAQLEQQLSQSVPQSRGGILRSITTAVNQTQPGSPAVMLTPPAGQPGGWPQPPPPAMWAPGNVGTQVRPLGSSEPSGVGNENYRKMFEQKSKEYQQLLVQMNSMKEEMKERTRSISEEEQTVRPGTLRPPSPGVGDVESTVKPQGVMATLSPADAKVLETLSDHLIKFCITAEKLKPGVSDAVKPSQPASSPAAKARSSTSPALYPALNLDDYSVISMQEAEGGRRSGTVPAPVATQAVQALLPQANQMLAALQSNIETMSKGPTASAASFTSTSIKIAKPNEYGTGDIVLFNPVKLLKSGASAPILMHLEKPWPYIFMDLGSYGLFGIRPGRIPDLIVARLTENPRALQFENDKNLAMELGVSKGEFFKVRAEPTNVKFTSTRPPTRPPSVSGSGRPQAPVRPPPPSSTAPKSPKAPTKEKHGFQFGKYLDGFLGGQGKGSGSGKGFV